MANRTTKITGRVFRNLKRHGDFNDDVQDLEIYGELQNAVNHIISESNPDKEIVITLKDGQEDYPLTTDTVSDPALETYSNNIASVKVVEQPSSFLYSFRIFTNLEFAQITSGNRISWVGLTQLFGNVNWSSYIVTQVDLVGVKDGVNTAFTIPEDITKDSEEIFLNGVLQIRDTDYSIVNRAVTYLSATIPDSLDSFVCNYIKASYFGNSIVNTHQPLIGTIINKRLKMYPIPNADYDALKITLMVYLKSATTSLSDTVDPEVDDEYDKALELFATAQFLLPQERVYYESEFKREVLRLRPIGQRKIHTLSRPKVM